jgi:D-lyxose ketol-isomerase
MKRSEINNLILQAKGFMAEHRFALPPFAFWSPDDWKAKSAECREIAHAQLGWDITDFGSGEFAKIGLLLFTVRNGTLSPDARTAKTYAEKIMIVREGQVTPCHFHHQKMEDIINRGGGVLVIQLWNATAGNKLDAGEVVVSLDGVQKCVRAGGTVSLQPGESITLPPRLYHKFWGLAGKGMVLVGEVSRVNDDHTDNRFFEKVGRFPAIEEDQLPLHLLVTDYGRYYPFA